MPFGNIVARSQLPFPSHETVIADREVLSGPCVDLIEGLAITMRLSKQETISLSLGMRNAALLCVDYPAETDIAALPLLPLCQRIVREHGTEQWSARAKGCADQ